jgi:hypothetical protein
VPWLSSRCPNEERASRTRERQLRRLQETVPVSFQGVTRIARRANVYCQVRVPDCVGEALGPSGILPRPLLRPVRIKVCHADRGWTAQEFSPFGRGKTKLSDTFLFFLLWTKHVKTKILTWSERTSVPSNYSWPQLSSVTDTLNNLTYQPRNASGYTALKPRLEIV